MELYNSTEEITKKGLFKTTIIAGNGIFEEKESWIGRSLKQKSDYQFTGFPNLEENYTIAELTDLPKIPQEALLAVVKWYRDITLKNDNEAQVNFYQTKGKELEVSVEGVMTPLSQIPGYTKWSDDIFSYTPKQTNSKASTKAKDPIYDALNRRFGFFVETHSHNSMSAFRSGTDEANSDFDALQLVFGKLNTENIEFFNWITVRELQIENVGDDQLSKFLEIPEYSLDAKGKRLLSSELVDSATYPKDWDAQVKNVTPKTYSKFTKPYYLNNYLDNYYKQGVFDFEVANDFEWAKDSMSTYTDTAYPDVNPEDYYVDQNGFWWYKGELTNEEPIEIDDL